MHMSDALISSAVGVTMLAASAGLIGYCSKKIKEDLDDRNIPLMGVLGAFIFAAQMINFTIPATGSSGHIGGGMLLAILLGPYAAFIVLASILTIQALFFADGGILAIGCNIMNLGFFPCFIAYPLIYKNIVKNKNKHKQIITATILSTIAGLLLGSFGVVMETVISKISVLPFKQFVLLMMPIHLAIGIIEGFISAGIIIFLMKNQPEMIFIMPQNTTSIRKSLVIIGFASIITASIFSWFASSNPDGLEWSIYKIAGKEIEQKEESVHQFFALIQDKTSIMPDYQFKNIKESENNAKSPYPSINAGTSTAGILGGIMTLAVIFFIGFILKKLN